MPVSSTVELPAFGFRRLRVTDDATSVEDADTAAPGGASGMPARPTYPHPSPGSIEDVQIEIAIVKPLSVFPREVCYGLACSLVSFRKGSI